MKISPYPYASYFGVTSNIQERDIVSMAVAALSSFDHDMRILGGTLLSRVLAMLAPGPFREHTEVGLGRGALRTERNCFLLICFIYDGKECLGLKIYLYSNSC